MTADWACQLCYPSPLTQAASSRCRFSSPGTTPTSAAGWRSSTKERAALSSAASTRWRPIAAGSRKNTANWGMAALLGLPWTSHRWHHRAMDDITRRHWEQIADRCFDRAYRATAANLMPQRYKLNPSNGRQILSQSQHPAIGAFGGTDSTWMGGESEKA